MCLLFTRPANAPHLSDEWLKDFYSRNRDGFGVMYAKGDVLWTAKGIGTAEDWINFFRKYDSLGVDCVYHLRMKTHGHIDLTNCHPYEVYGDGAAMPIYMMHNGVLATGNDKDRSKSDTWHFIRDYIHPLTKAEPSLVFTPEFEHVMGKFIGNNRFAFMNHLGQTQIVNKHQGVEWGGMWLSNTYAWDYYKAVPDKRPSYGNSSYLAGKSWSDWRSELDKKAKAPAKTKQKSKVKVSKQPATVTTFPTKSREDKIDHEVSAAVDDIMIRSMAVHEKITLAQVQRLFKEFDTHDAWRWIEAFSYSQGREAEDKFLEGMRDPRKIKDWLNSMDQLTTSDFI